MFDWLFGRRHEETKSETPVLDTETGPPAFAERLEQARDTSPQNLEPQLDHLNQQIANLLDEAGKLREQLERLTQRTSFGNEQLGILIQHLSDVAGWAGPLDSRLAELTTWAEQSREELTQLEESIRKLSRTQFRANSLAESQQERLQSALETLQDLAARKQADADKAWQEQRQAVEAARREARVAMAVVLFPALDGLESVLENGRALLKPSQQPAPKPGFLARLAYAFGVRDLPVTHGGDSQALAAWLDGLELVHERFLALLQAEGIQPIRAEGRPFDPHRHVAVEAVTRSDVPPGTVIAEHRPGYRLGERVLRYAEVVVTRDGVVEEPETALELEEPAVGELVKIWGATDEEWEGTHDPEAAEREPPEGTQEPEALEEVAEPEEPEMETAMPVSETPGCEVGADLQTTPEMEAATPVSDTEAMPVGDVERAGGVSQETEDDTQSVDPEIDEIIARFEARRQARHS